MRTVLGKKSFVFLLTAICLPFFIANCATGYLKGVNPAGEKMYAGPVPIEKTEAYQTYFHSKQTEADKHIYLFKRLKDAVHLEFYRDGSWYNSLEVYRGGMWLMRRRYKKGVDTRKFIRKYIERSENTHQYHLVKYSDGSVHIGSYILYNELDLLEETAKRDSALTAVKS